MPGQSYRSKLNPHLDFIREARLRGETWEAIAAGISGRGTPTDRSQVCRFFRRRLAGKRPAGFAPESGAGGRPPSGGPAPMPLEDDPMESAPRPKLVLKVRQPKQHNP